VNSECIHIHYSRELIHYSLFTSGECLRLASLRSLRKKHDPFITDDWDDATFDDIDWKSIQASLESKTTGEHYQLSKFINNWTPTLHHRATQDNSIDRQCFERVQSMARNN
jgi:hypothetical protein